MTNWFRSHRKDILAVAVLLVLWAAFFWRFLTPVEADQVSLAEGDFSGQFVAFGAYQAERLWAGEVPLWNPYNNGGHPFLADTQSAVFYPPRLLTIALTGLTGTGVSPTWTYHALELEMMAHILLASLLMYALVRRLTLGAVGSVAGALVAALTWAYGGFMTGYPPLQLALLEAVVWAPLIVLGIHEATTGARVRWSWLVLSGVAFGMSVLTGHPQTYWFLGWLLVLFLAYRVYKRRYLWLTWVGGVALIGGLAVALALVQLLPAAEYLQHTTRIDYGFDAKSNGFPIHDVLQIIFPRVVSVWSPLYVGLVGLALAGIALWKRVQDWLFWGSLALVSLLFSFGGNAALYGLLYNVLPGLKLFRGQERGAMLVALALSILAGLGLSALIGGAIAAASDRRTLRRALLVLLWVIGFVVLVAFVLWLGPANEFYGDKLPALAFSLLVMALLWGALWWLLGNLQSRWRQSAVIALLVFDLFTVSWDNLLVESIPAQDRLPEPAVVQIAAADETVPPQRVDGQRGLLANYGTLWRIPDIRGISPLWLQGPYALVGQEFPNPLAWELLAVRYVFTDWEELPVASTIVGQGEDGYGPVNVHRLADERPFALLLDDVALVDSDAFAAALLADPNFDPRQSVILDEQGLSLPDGLAVTGTASVTHFAPEEIIVETMGDDTPAILSLALPHYPGWVATVDGESVPIFRAYGAVSAIVLPSGSEVVRLVYDPLTYKIGAGVSLFAWGAVLVFGVWLVVRRLRQGRTGQG